LTKLLGSIAVGGSNNNGTLQSVTEQLANSGTPAPQSSLTSFSQSYGYDMANRLQTASDSGGWTRRYGYDNYGKMWVGVASGVGLSRGYSH
jgi:hypothetical protein